jgi:hypothetical protein
MAKYYWKKNRQVPSGQRRFLPNFRNFRVAGGGPWRVGRVNLKAPMNSGGVLLLTGGVTWAVATSRRVAIIGEITVFNFFLPDTRDWPTRNPPFLVVLVVGYRIGVTSGHYRLPFGLGDFSKLEKKCEKFGYVRKFRIEWLKNIYKRKRVPQSVI